MTRLSGQAARNRRSGLEAEAQPLPRILVLGLGGTIVSTAASRVESASYLPTESLSSLLEALPEASSLARIETRQLARVGSQEIGSTELLALAEAAGSALGGGGIDGVVVTHGTDTLEETAFFLHLTVAGEKPVVLTGAMRPASALSCDGPMNLLDAIGLAASPESVGRGVMVAASGRIFAARAVSKMHTNALDAFRAPEEGSLGALAGARPSFFGPPSRVGAQAAPFDLCGLGELPAVDILYGHQEVRPALFEAALAAGARGLVFAGTGNGTLSEAAKHGARLAAASGVAFVRSSRVGSGHVSAKAADRELGTIAAGALNPQKARILLRLALTRTRDRDALQDLFDGA